MNLKRFWIALITGLLLVAPLPGRAAFDAFLSIPGVPGESTNSAHPNWIVVLRITNDLRQATSPGQSGTRVKSSLVILKELDKASPLLYQACATGLRYSLLTLELSDPLAPNPVFYGIIIGNAVIKSVIQDSTTLGPSGRPVEQVLLEYDRVIWTYTRVSTADTYAAYWDLVWNYGGILPLPFRVTFTRPAPDQLALSWIAKPGKAYRVFSSLQAQGPYTLLDTAVPGSDGLVNYLLHTLGGAMFLTVEEQ